MSRSRLWEEGWFEIEPPKYKKSAENRVILQRLLRGLGFVQYKSTVGYSHDCRFIYSAHTVCPEFL
jgi:hypothetical protein